MTRFLLRLLLFVTLLPFATAAAFVTLRFAHDTVVDVPRDAIRVWGDSRTYRGLDLALLGELTGRPVRSWARNGAGPYSLFAFADQVPDGGDVILGIDVQIFLRANENNAGGLSLAGLRRIAASPAYSRRDMLDMLDRNRNPLKPRWRTRHELYPVRPELDRGSWNWFTTHYADASPPPGYAERIALYREAVRSLAARGCRVHVVEVPPSPAVRELRRSSIYAGFGETIDALAGERVRVLRDVDLDGSGDGGSRLFFDLSHLNRDGAGRFTRRYFEQLWLADHPPR